MKCLGCFRILEDRVQSEHTCFSSKATIRASITILTLALHSLCTKPTQPETLQRLPGPTFYKSPSLVFIKILAGWVQDRGKPLTTGCPLHLETSSLLSEHLCSYCADVLAATGIRSIQASPFSAARMKWLCSSYTDVEWLMLRLSLTQ